MKQNWINAALLSAVTFTSAAFAERPLEPIVLDEMVVTATRMPQPLAQTIADTTVINEQEIRQSGVPDVPTLLRSLAGVEVVQSGGLGNVSSTFMRGTNSSHVLVLLDGVRINSATAGTTALEHIMLDSIERIEVVRGNVSSLYGSEAIGGVIQLFTKRGHGTPALNASFGVGSHGTRRASAGYSGNVDATSFSVNVGKAKTDGISAINTSPSPNANPDNDGYDNTTLNAQVKYAVNADHQLSASVFKTRGDSQYDNAFGVPTDRNNSLANIDKLSLASDNQLGSMWHSSLRLAKGSDENRDLKNDAQQSRFETTNNQLTWQNELKLSDHQHANLAAEHLGQKVSSTTQFNQTSRKVNSLLGGYVAEYGAHQVQLNLRHDRYSDFGKANTGMLGYALSYGDHWRVTANLGSAFKAPTFNDLFFPGFSNPNLHPERSENKEMGLHYAANGHRFDAVYFDNRIRDLIAVDSTFTTMINVKQAQIDGLVLSYAGTFGEHHLKANMTTQNPRDATTGQLLARRAEEFASIAATRDFDKLNAGAEVRYSGERKDGARTLTSYHLLNLTANYKIDAHLNVLARVDNLTNRNYSDVYSYNSLGRTVFVGLQYQQ